MQNTASICTQTSLRQSWQDLVLDFLVKTLMTTSRKTRLRIRKKKDSQGTSKFPEQSLVVDKEKPPPDDFTNAQTHTCSIHEFAKSFTVPLEGDKGTKRYHDKGLFLPKRCKECIQSFRTNWKSNRPTESQLSQADHVVDDPTADPDAVGSLFADVSDVSGSRPVPGSTANVNPGDQCEPQNDQPTTVTESTTAVSRHYLFPLPLLQTRRLPIATYFAHAWSTEHLHTNAAHHWKAARMHTNAHEGVRLQQV